MGPDTTLKPIKPPRGLILSTGEDIPHGQSLRARLLTIELDPETLDWQKLTRAQTDAAGGLYAQAMAGYLRWLAPQYTEITSRFPVEVARLRAAASQNGTHRRTPVIVAELATAAGYFLDYARQTGAISQAEADERRHRTWQALTQAAVAQHRNQTAADPALRFRELLTAAITAGRAHLTTADGTQPENPGAWGWHQTPTPRSGRECLEWRPRGEKVGWLTEEGLFLEPDAAYAAAQKLARDNGETITVTAQTLRKRLHEHGLLATTDHESRGRLTVRRTLQGKRRDILQPGQPHNSPPAIPMRKNKPAATPTPTHQGVPPGRRRPLGQMGRLGRFHDTEHPTRTRTGHGGTPPPGTDAPAP